ncbi:hypothetical protein FF38_04515 [Lucilia cuprina]|uniref:Uncharacterized protein n=1 Tax=Lucilia cuprina TaxID=7375 RepID=A0A0L0BPW2_LUCCU|nr:hypothetical protein FF38_04515 [Lucilia cuprina]
MFYINEIGQLPLLSCCGSDITITNSNQTSNEVSNWVNTNPSYSYNFDIKNILSKTVTGIDILENYEKNNMLTDIDQNNVVRIFIDNIIMNGIKMDVKVMTAAAQAITFVFPNENEYTYFIPRSAKKMHLENYMTDTIMKNTGARPWT